MANECMNRLEIAATPSHSLYLLRAESAIESLRRGMIRSRPPIAPLVAALAAEGNFGSPRFELSARALRVDFESRWEPPVGAVAAFAAANPTLPVTLSYWEPCMLIYGRVRWLGGAVVSDEEFGDSKTALRAFSSSHWRPDRENALNTALMRLRLNLVLEARADAAETRSVGRPNDPADGSREADPGVGHDPDDAASSSVAA